eukprot:3845329-Pleurochrysis_carterae.AAC.2
MQIDRTVGDAVSLPPGLRPQRALYLPCLCIEAKLAQARDVLATVRSKAAELTRKVASLEEVWSLAKRVKDNARKALKKVEQKKLSFEAAPRRTPKRGTRGE